MRFALSVCTHWDTIVLHTGCSASGGQVTHPRLGSISCKGHFKEKEIIVTSFASGRNLPC